jgi:hypothetical protein
MRRLTAHEWWTRRSAYRARVGPLAEARLRRVVRGEKHPVHDFLFEYYPFKPAHLLRWSPGAGVVLVGATGADWPGLFADADGGLSLDAAAFVAKRADYLRWAADYLRRTGNREPAFGCFGLHEWAMVYRADARRHPLPLRLSPTETDAVVSAAGVKCTHFDAYRFFTPAAVPLNRQPLNRIDTPANDQPGCVHVTMDLYKWAYKAAPFIPSELVADAFELAVAARELDMRASPYDLSALGHEPVRVETRAGREEYVAAQQDLHHQAAPVRANLLAAYERLLHGTSATHT